MTTRQFIRARAESHLSVAEIATALREALDAGGTVEIHDEVGTAPDRPAFTLHARGHGVIARAPGGRQLGTFGDALLGVQHAFALLDRAMPEQPAPCSRSRRSTRGAAPGARR